MKKNRDFIIIILAVICIISVIVLCFVFSDSVHKSKISGEKLQFSHSSGFYDNDFELEIKGQGDIYYTLDGSVPTAESIKYTGPIHISDASNNPNVISAIEDVSVCFDKNLQKAASFFDIGNCNYYTVPVSLIDKITIIRAISISPSQEVSPIKSASYFVNFKNKTGYDGMNIVSIITDPENLFDSEAGIYVLGDSFEYFINNTKTFTEKEDAIITNYSMRGHNAEKLAYVEFFNPNKELVQHKNIGLRVQGNISRIAPKKAFGFFARKKYDNKPVFKSSLTKTKNSLERLALFTASYRQDDTNLEDFLVHNLINDNDIGTLTFVPYIAFLNGEYWGFYWLTEVYDAEFISQKYNIKNKNDIIIFKNDRMEAGNEDSQNAYDYLNYFLDNKDFSSDENLEQLNKIIDIQSFAKYLGIELYIDNIDFYLKNKNNIALWRTKTSGGKDYYDGRWRPLLFDVNCAFLYMDRFECWEHLTKEAQFLNLISNKKFKNMLISEMIKLSLNEFSPEKAEKIIDNEYKLLKVPMEKNLERYFEGNIKKVNEIYEWQIGYLKRFFVQRPQIIYNKFCSELDYAQDIEKEVKDVCDGYRQN